VRGQRAIGNTVRGGEAPEVTALSSGRQSLDNYDNSRPSLLLLPGRTLLALTTLGSTAQSLSPKQLFRENVVTPRASAILFQADASSFAPAAVACARADADRRLRGRPGQYRWAVVISHDLAVRGNPCSGAPDGQGVMVAPVQVGR
jgi:hypothetical protein